MSESLSTLEGSQSQRNGQTVCSLLYHVYTNYNNYNNYTTVIEQLIEQLIDNHNHIYSEDNFQCIFNHVKFVHLRTGQLDLLCSSS